MYKAQTYVLRWKYIFISNYVIYVILQKSTISYSVSREGFIFSYMNELYRSKEPNMSYTTQ